MTPQPLLIFRKDLMHLWPETLVSLVLFVAFAWSAPSGWHQSEYAAYVGLLSGLLHLLMPIAWIVVISRLIHDEPLVGDRQFWTSRPYHWGLLLTAKVLYILAFIYLPFLLMQVYLLKHAGLYPTTVLPALLHNLLLLTVIIIVPVAAIAAVTATFARLLLSIVGGLLYVIAVFGVLAYYTFRHMPPPHFTTITATILILLPAVALVYQYATRKTTVSRLLLVAAPLLAVLIYLLLPTTALIRSGYPVAKAGEDPGLTPMVIPNAPADLAAGKIRSMHGDSFVSLPFQVKSTDADSNYVVDGEAVTLTGGGVHYTSAYIASGEQVNASRPFVVLPFSVPTGTLEQVRTAPVDVHLSLAADHLKAAPASTWKANAGTFDIPGHGVCSFDTSDNDLPPTCRFPFKLPELLYVNAPVTPGTCANPTGAPRPGRQLLRLDTPSLLDFDPVVTVPLELSAGDPKGGTFALCAGTPMAFVEGKSVGKVRLELDEKQIVLDPFIARIAPKLPPGHPPLGAPDGEPRVQPE